MYSQHYPLRDWFSVVCIREKTLEDQGKRTLATHKDTRTKVKALNISLKLLYNSFFILPSPFSTETKQYCVSDATVDPEAVSSTACLRGPTSRNPSRLTLNFPSKLSQPSTADILTLILSHFLTQCYHLPIPSGFLLMASRRQNPALGGVFADNVR
ncbi:hypothetical protein ADUPG1_008105 [Aduncisulcus paluster]|uniref:Uncharacterized protein n=1 Tax=Aduncisulcus paluster TaxID=2918883 RepID=A0ABQ5KQR4_9EUKA|nr:hypothetical protein ADUPG1_008105 [Aduncisulcus paluster]